MIFGNNDLSVIISLISDVQYTDDDLKKFFQEEIDVHYDQIDKKWMYSISQSNINRIKKDEFLWWLCIQNATFQLNINTKNNQFYEIYSFNKNDDFITKKYLYNSLPNTMTKKYLRDGRVVDEVDIDITFQQKQRKIKIQEIIE